MKPVSRRALSSTNLNNFNIAIPKSIASIKGSIRKLGQQYKDATVVLYDKENLLPIAVRKPDENGGYQFFGLNTDLKTFIAAFDQNQEYNAVIQDNVVPK